jgi:hypothetical protein
VRGVPQARDEYYSYLSRVFSMLLSNATEQEIASYLVNVEEESMGLAPNKENAVEIAQTLIDIKEWVIDEAS